MSPALLAASLLGGLVLLSVGADRLVAGASRVALLTGLSPLVVGLTVVAFGTSTPELVIAVTAGLEGKPDLAVGNVVGSNVFNVLFILGAAGLIAPLAVAPQLVRIEVPIMIGASLLAWGMAADGAIGRLDGLLLATGMAVYTTWAIRRSRREAAARPAATAGARPDGQEPRRGLVLLGGVLQAGVGLALLVVGAELFVGGAVALARAMGVSDLVIGLTIVSAGTSLPEVATSLVATLRGQRDIAIGNVVGSNIYNLLAVLGVSAAVTPGGLPVARALFHFDLPVMVAVAVACLPIFLTGRSIARLEAATFLGFYLAYVAYVVLQAQDHDALPAVSAIMLEFVVPLAALGIAVSLWRHFRGGPAAPR